MQMRERQEVKWIHRYVVVFTKTVFVKINSSRFTSNRCGILGVDSTLGKYVYYLLHIVWIKAVRKLFLRKTRHS